MGVNGIIVKGDNSPKTLTSTAGDDALVGTYAAEVFYSGLGDDDMYGAAGNDYFYADLGDDFIDGGSGTDTISFDFVNLTDAYERSTIGVSFDLTKGKQDLGYYGVKQVYNVENIEGTQVNDRLYGNEANNRLRGLAGNDRLDGRDGNDRLEGEAGNDTLVGGSGDDQLVGSSGSDKFFSGTGADVLSGYFENGLTDDGARDTFVYSSTSDSGTKSTTRDTIYGFFSGSDGDKIDLSGIDANGSKSGDGKFTFIGSNSFHSNSTSEVQVIATGNANEFVVNIDTDSDNKAEMRIVVYSTSALTASDFIL